MRHIHKAAVAGPVRAVRVRVRRFVRREVNVGPAFGLVLHEDDLV